ncbi:MAG: R3H domain protein [Candidatus Amesbacteria bacterium GW2011_GWA2_42_12]|uniref:R3H domain protein n=1 Tax=Candidatus Amesbacteria bacterium GW2011_GWA2_42_12 TaxID=1618356 RepID=A0A0G0Y923_9BACT|nr:MAG: R3H domain protein [Candidatus Amesbacteria bacterium GW2011_GWA2_42_12]
MDHTSTVADYSARFLDTLGISAKATVTFDPDNNVYLISLETQDPAPIIGYHGDTLSSLQLVLGLHLKHLTGDWINISINVNDYRERRELSIKAMVDSAVAQVVASKTPITLAPLPANERRIVHVYLDAHKDVTTSSVGEGKSRSVVISPKV